MQLVNAKCNDLVVLVCECEWWRTLRKRTPGSGSSICEQAHSVHGLCLHGTGQGKAASSWALPPPLAFLLLLLLAFLLLPAMRFPAQE